MEQINVRGCGFTVLSLGTVQLGLAYGLNKAAGKPDRQTAFDVLNQALSGGVNSLDTAAAYGDAEEVIGDWLKTVPASRQPYVATKVNALDHTSLTALRASLRAQVEQCKKRLGIETIPVLMIHHCEEYLDDPENMRTVFQELKASGDIRFSGISAYAFHDYGRIAGSGFDAVQIPVNLFDWRQIDNGGIRKLQDAGMIVFARSVFLQGLVFRKPDQLDERMAFCAPTLRKLDALCQRWNMSPGEVAFSFARSIPGMTSLVIGCRSGEQARKTVWLAEHTDRLTDGQMEELRQLFGNTDEKVITPTLW